MDVLISAALDIAKRAHEGQKRKYTNEPYITHPLAVAGLVRSVSDDDDLFIAAILHDVVEDSHITIETITGIFGSYIGMLVDSLTDISELSDGNRSKRKRIDREHLAGASPGAKTIKLADLIDNTKAILPYDEEFGKIYLQEKRLLLDVLGDGNKYLHNVAKEILEYWEDRLRGDGK